MTHTYRISITFLLLLFSLSVKAQMITTFAGNDTAGFSGDGGPVEYAKFSAPFGVVLDKKGNMYVADYNNNRIRKIDSTHIVSTIGGNGLYGFGGDGGFANAAIIEMPSNITIDGYGNLYFFSAYRIRKIDTTGIITTIAGNGNNGFSGDGGPADSAELGYTYGIAVDSKGNVYLADGDHSRIRKIDTSGMISTIAGNDTAGSSGDGGLAIAAELSYPTGLACDLVGNLYVVDVNNGSIRKIDTAGIITRIAGSDTATNYSDGVQATATQLAAPMVITTDSFGNIYFGDMGGVTIRKINTAGIINTIAGNGVLGYSGDGGFADSAQISRVSGIAVDDSGNVYFSDLYNQRIRKINNNVLPITGASSLCLGATSQLSDATPGGIWKSLDTSIATVDSSGLVTGKSAGKDTIIYGGVVFTTVTIHPYAGKIIGANSIGIGLSDTLTSTVPGGIWSTSNPAITTVDSLGVVTGISLGADTIFYAVTNNCGSAQTQYAVNVYEHNTITGTVTIDNVNGNPAQPIFRVWLMAYDSISNVISFVDSTTDTGNTFIARYQFVNEPAGVYIVKAALPDSLGSITGPAPTYLSNSLYWDKAKRIYYSGNGISQDHDILIKEGTTTTGDGSISGNISIGTISTPVPHLLVLLKNIFDSFYAFTYTDSNGNYSFSNLPVAHFYYVYPEAETYKTTQYNYVDVSATEPNQRWINFKEDTFAKTITPTGVGIKNIINIRNIVIYPNPARDGITLSTQNYSGDMAVSIYDVIGQMVMQQTVNTDHGSARIPLKLLPGSYFLHLKTQDSDEHVERLVIY